MTLSDYLNINCPFCGSNEVQTFVWEDPLEFNALNQKVKYICNKCKSEIKVEALPETLPETSIDGLASSASLTNNMEFECCPVCGQKLTKSSNGLIKECNNCSYKIETRIGDITNDAPGATKAVIPVNEPDNKPGLYGWICPKCGAVMSPYTDFCINCTKYNFEITCTTTGTNSIKDETKSFINNVNNGKLPQLEHNPNLGLHTSKYGY